MRNRRKHHLPEGDDGHTVVNMNVEGMPGYKPSRPDAVLGPEQPADVAGPPPDRLTRQETRWMIGGSLRAALLVFGVMAAGIVLFVLFTLWMTGR